MLKNLATASSLVPLGSEFNHFIIDEVDILSGAHQRKLRNIMDTPVSIFYFTTNELRQIDGGIRSRCHVINCCAAEAEQWLPLFSRVLQDGGASVPDASVMLPLIDKCGGSVRDIVTEAHIIAAHRVAKGHIVQAVAAVTPPAAIDVVLEEDAALEAEEQAVV